MKKLGLWVGGLVVGFVVLALLFDAFVGAAQPELQAGPSEGVLYTLDAEGNRIGTRLAVVDDADGNVWVQSGHHFRGWYERVLANPEVEMQRGGELEPYTAVPIDTPESEALVRKLLRDRAGPVRFAIIRTVLLFADIKPVRLDPRQTGPRAR